jgi:phosphoribosyl 1,2-cyclic phosphodiesterase
MSVLHFEEITLQGYVPVDAVLNHLLCHNRMVSFIMGLHKRKVMMTMSVLHFEEITLQVLGFLCTSIIVQHRKTMHSNHYSSNRIKSNENDQEK